MKTMIASLTALFLSHAAFAAVPCQNQDFVAVKGPVVIKTVGMSYSPKCIKIKAGTKVTIQASAMHPLAAMAPFQNAANPFEAAQDFTKPQARVMKTRGVFGYFCTNHGDISGNGMAGMILVE